MSKRTVKVWSPSGEMKQVAPLNANDLVTHCGYSRTPPIVAAAPAPKAKEADAGNNEAEVQPDPDGSEEERQAWLDNIGGDETQTNNEDEDEE